MTNIIDVKVPDIGDFKDVPIIEISVKPGDVVKIDDPLLTLESDKASMEVPSPSAGTVKEVLVKVGDRVGKDKLIVRLEGGDVPSAAHAAPANSAQYPCAHRFDRPKGYRIHHHFGRVGCRRFTWVR